MISSISIREFPTLAWTITVLVAIATGKTNVSANASSTEDAKVVAGLDTKYQAAVKNNDVATMDQILADDFVLVVGSGRVSTKAESNQRSANERSDLRTSGGRNRFAESESVG